MALANTLITEPDFLILDEPTNHLDLEMIEWLENFLSRGNKTLLMMLHTIGIFSTVYVILSSSSIIMLSIDIKAIILTIFRKDKPG